ncbi:polysaccharide deacetylase family protein [Vacuolonema iberomarrocanum]|uniref:polysaccharide deacetylase family protein n=1 Tax=Vacuolonema iberomarrocanum TaxID=3454632 RepID=UPI0019EFEC24|nr:polysaccharide deacetylase [filamentous cyanobacterium LEGE 07170]
MSSAISHRETKTLPSIETTPINNFRGPNGELCVVSIGWHVDGEAGVIATDAKATHHVAALSEGAYGVSTAIPRILEMHRALEIPSSFFIPGYVADLHPDAVEAVVNAEHEVAHHGYMHENCFYLSESEQQDVFQKGIQSLQHITGKAPVGWSAPGWGVTPETLKLLCEFGMIYDASLMEYDNPYWVTTESGPLVELPISMILDDWEIFGASPVAGGGINATAETAFQIWKEEFDGMRRFGGFFSPTFHPNLMGRPGRLNMLYRLFEYMRSFDDVWWATCEDVARYVQATTSPPAHANTATGTRL